MQITLFSHVALSCIEPEETERYYRENFGFRRTRVIGEGADAVVFIKSDFSPVYLELFRSKGEQPGPRPEGPGPEYPGFRHLAFQVDDLAAKLAEIGADAQLTLGPLDFGSVIPGWKTAWVRDPDGRIVEISQGYRDAK
jgi:glyoxylase I family protein